MAAGPTRPDDDLRRGIGAWLGELADGPAARCAVIERPSAGWSNETVIVTLDRFVAALAVDASRGTGSVPEAAPQRLVIRLAPLVASYPDYDLGAQAAVLVALGRLGVPAPGVVALVDDQSFLGAPFLVMSCLDGRPIGEVPALDPWVATLGPDRQQRVHDQCFDALAAVHRADPDVLGIGAALRRGLRDELAYWSDYVEWSTGGSPPRRLADGLRWCGDTAPAEPPPSLLWGDARLGNAMYCEQGTLVGLLDWELATVGPAEMDLGWYQVLDAVMERFVGAAPRGFPTADELTRLHAERLGRPMEDLGWHRVFALCRSIAINDRQARLAAVHHTAYPGIAGDGNPLLDVLVELIDATA